MSTMLVLVFLIGFPIDWLWLQLCIGSHGHVCDIIGLSAHAVCLWFTNDYYDLYSVS